MAKVVPFPNTRPIVDEMGMMTGEVRILNEALFNRIPITGSGTPEGNVEAAEGAVYYDITASTGSIHYVKTANSVGGDRTLGWILV